MTDSKKSVDPGSLTEADRMIRTVLAQHLGWKLAESYRKFVLGLLSTEELHAEILDDVRKLHAIRNGEHLPILLEHQPEAGLSDQIEGNGGTT